jgi:hypothetical protein
MPHNCLAHREFIKCLTQAGSLHAIESNLQQLIQDSTATDECKQHTMAAEGMQSPFQQMSRKAFSLKVY